MRRVREVGLPPTPVALGLRKKTTRPRRGSWLARNGHGVAWGQLAGLRTVGRRFGAAGWLGHGHAAVWGSWLARTGSRCGLGQLAGSISKGFVLLASVLVSIRFEEACWTSSLVRSVQRYFNVTSTLGWVRCGKSIRGSELAREGIGIDGWGSGLALCGITIGFEAAGWSGTRQMGFEAAGWLGFPVAHKWGLPLLPVRRGERKAAWSRPGARCRMPHGRRGACP
jgi:hypothetical protein